MTEFDADLMLESLAEFGMTIDENGKVVKKEKIPVPEPTTLQDLVEEAVADQFSITSGWKAQKGIKFVVELPSGQRALVKRLNTIDLINADILDDMDFFTKALIPKTFDASGNPVFENDPSSFWSALRDPEKRLRFFSLLNRLVEAAVVNPVVINDGAEIITNNQGKRIVVQGSSVITRADGVEIIQLEDGTLREIGEFEARTSEIDFADKMSIFSEVNKPLSQIRPFREEDISLAGVDSEQGIESAAE